MARNRQSKAKAKAAATRSQTEVVDHGDSCRKKTEDAPSLPNNKSKTIATDVQGVKKSKDGSIITKDLALSKKTTAIASVKDSIEDTNNNTTTCGSVVNTTSSGPVLSCEKKTKEPRFEVNNTLKTTGIVTAVRAVSDKLNTKDDHNRQGIKIVPACSQCKFRPEDPLIRSDKKTEDCPPMVLRHSKLLELVNNIRTGTDRPTEDKDNSGPRDNQSPSALDNGSNSVSHTSSEPACDSKTVFFQPKNDPDQCKMYIWYLLHFETMAASYKEALERRCKHKDKLKNDSVSQEIAQIPKDHVVEHLHFPDLPCTFAVPREQLVISEEEQKAGENSPYYCEQAMLHNLDLIISAEKDEKINSMCLAPFDAISQLQNKYSEIRAFQLIRWYNYLIDCDMIRVPPIAPTETVYNNEISRVKALSPRQLFHEVQEFVDRMLQSFIRARLTENVAELSLFGDPERYDAATEELSSSIYLLAQAYESRVVIRHRSLTAAGHNVLDDKSNQRSDRCRFKERKASLRMRCQQAREVSNATGRMLVECWAEAVSQTRSAPPYATSATCLV